jgi:hypothetical protein
LPHTLASEITVDAADMVANIQSVLDTVQTTQAYVPPKGEPPKTVRPPENESTPEYRVLRTWNIYGDKEGSVWTDEYEERKYPPGTSGGEYQLWKNGIRVKDTTSQHTWPLVLLGYENEYLEDAVWNIYLEDDKYLGPSQKANLAKLSILSV